MLDILRQGAQSWIIKVLFGAIIVVFVLAFGMGSTNRGSSSTVIATVNEEPILLKDFEQTVQRQFEAFRAQNPGISQEFLQQIHFKNEILSSMITQELLRQKAAEWQLSVSAEELRQEIHALPAFQNTEHQFDPKLYKELLHKNGMLPAQFETQYRQGLLMDKIREYIALTGTVDPNQAKDLYMYGQSTTSVGYLVYPWEKYASQVTITEEDMQDSYKKNQEPFRFPSKIELSYLLLSPATLADPQSINESTVEKYYAEHKEAFVQEEQVSARHLLISLPQNATAEETSQAEKRIQNAQAELTKGKPFAQVAESYTEDPSGKQTGGALGWFERGRMVKPFEDAAFNTAKGETSSVVRTRFGLHLIHVDDHKEAGYTPLAEVREQIRQTLARNKAQDSLQDVVDQAQDLVLSGSDLEDVARQIHPALTVQTTKPFAQAAGPQELPGLSSEDLAALFDLNVNATLETPLLLKDGYLLARKKTAVPAGVLPFESVKDQVQATLTEQKSLALAKKAADEDALNLAKNATLANGETPEPELSPAFTRQQSVPGLGQSPELTTAAFSGAQAWIEKSFSTQKGYVVLQAKEIHAPSEDDWQRDKERWTASLSQRAKDQAVQVFVDELRANANIAIINERALD